MNNAPVLKGGNTYIPYSYINYMLKNENWNIGYAVYDTEGNIFALTSYPIYDENINGIPAKQIKNIAKVEHIENGTVYIIFTQS